MRDFAGAVALSPLTLIHDHDPNPPLARAAGASAAAAAAAAAGCGGCSHARGCVRRFCEGMDAQDTTTQAYMAYLEDVLRGSVDNAPARHACHALGMQFRATGVQLGRRYEYGLAVDRSESSPELGMAASTSFSPIPPHAV